MAISSFSILSGFNPDLGVRRFIAALFREIHFAEVLLDGINSVVKGGNELPHSMLIRDESINQFKLSFRL
ncbi:MAG TPA: hypothetical protein DCZ94_03910 [Lentisphaeria bacterium]|nr:MAG: hypothetical protein A2X48_05130 [Lentisphaerae bacterium GWF2_49_21]HBC86080.1 hypothetical protein [Lentisphaeria bacterium]